MSKLLIQKYYNQLHEILNSGGTRNEGSITFAFATLLRAYAEKKGLLLVEQFEFVGRSGKRIRPDGTMKYFGGIDVGYWEAKDTKDNLNEEINKKLNEAGYPNKNIIFEDTQTAVLIQEGAEVMRISMNEWNLLDDLLDKFVDYQPSEVKEFNKALEHFKEDVPTIVAGLRELMEQAAETNQTFREVRDVFLEIARSEINPEITPEDIREMIIQHILTEDIFTNVFGDADFHHSNNIARELENVIETFMTREIRRNYLSSIENYYKTIRDAASGITDNHEKQKFLKTVYENFYKVYNPKGADKLGVVYTPNEIVRFMIDSTDWLLEKHFGKSLSDKGVDILDPATGTGTFIAELIDRISIHNLEYKYENELHANEVAILPYYIANLNIEYTYQQRTKRYKEFKNICFVDTLDNTNALDYSGKQDMLFGISSENAKRIQDQNAKKISVIIGNPPYNAKQPNYNFQNANRGYKEIDRRIKDTYIKNGTAQNQNAVYDMFTRFYRWSSDRVANNSVICFITNSTYVDSRTYDGFRKSIQDEFDYAYIVDFGGDIRKLSGKDGIWMNEENTIFGVAAAVGISVMWLVKDETRDKKLPCKIKYIHPNDIRATRREKFEWIQNLNSFGDVAFETIEPDAKNNWINQTNNDWDSLMPLIDKDVKAGKSEEAVFKLFSSGLKTQRDEWVYDFSKIALEEKIRYFIDVYEATRKDKHFPDKMKIKWDDDLSTYLKRNIKKQFIEEQIIISSYRPFNKRYFYFDKHFNGRTYQWQNIYNKNKQEIIGVPGIGSPKDFHTLAINGMMDLNSLPAGGQYLPLYSYDSENQKHENITDWALNQFQNHYDETNGGQITKQDIFYYVYGVLHCPQYRKKYEQNLKREFPRIPFYDDFTQWRDWGAALMDLHINYETVEPFDLGIRNLGPVIKKKVEQENLFTSNSETPEEIFNIKPKTKLRADKEEGIIEIDSQTALFNIPSIAWEYKLGNRSALEWILDQYKEKKPSDATIAERFNTYKFEDYKEQVIDLLKRVTNVSIKTMEIINQMPQE